MTIDSAPCPKFPLPRGYFGELHTTPEQDQAYKDRLHRQIEAVLRDEHAYMHSHERQIDQTKWKQVRIKHQFRLFRRRDTGLHEGDGLPSMIGVGRVEGSLEDLIYGAYDSTDDELRMTAELVDVDFMDGAVLKNIVQGTEDDPFNYVGIKWILTAFPVKYVMRDRDWVLLESMGITHDAHGARYGYHAIQTIKTPNCPPFPGIIRGTMFYTFIYREVQPGLVDVYAQGYFDCLGDLIDPLTVVGSAEMFNGVFRYVKAAESKKLSILALESLERKIWSNDQHSMTSRASSDDAMLRRAHCSVCASATSTNPFSTRRMRICRICDAIVCASCRVKKNILAGKQRVQTKVSVCQSCIARAKHMEIRPAEERFDIARNMNLIPTEDALWMMKMDAGQAQYPGALALRARPQGCERARADSDNERSAYTRHRRGAPRSMTAASSESGRTEDLDYDAPRSSMAALTIDMTTEAARARTQSHGSTNGHRRSLSTGSEIRLTPSGSVRPPATIPAVPAPTPSAKVPLPHPQNPLYFQMLALQQAANNAFELTQANMALMSDTTTTTTTTNSPRQAKP